MDYISEFEKAIVYIEANLQEDIKVEDVASRVGYSYYHFCRVFEAYLGESIGSYIRKRRLSKAAHELVYTQDRIIDIALNLKFESAEAFSRAFKKVYRTTPYNYRKNRIEGLLGNKAELNTTKLRHLLNNVTIQPVIVELEPTRIVGMRRKMQISNNQLPKLWELFNSRIKEVKEIKAMPRCFGICEYEPDLVFGAFDEETFHSQIVGIEVEQFKDIPEGMSEKIISGGKYAVFTHKGKLEHLVNTYNYIWGTWVPNCKYELDFRDDFEVYDRRFLGGNNALSELDIYVPLK